MKIIAIAGLLAALLISSCRKFIEVDAPPTNTSADVIFSEDATAASVMTGVYANIATGTITGQGLLSISAFPELSADNLGYYDISTAYGGALYYMNNVPSRDALGSYWQMMYQLIYKVNAALEGAGPSKKLTPAVKDQLMGEAYFMRAWFYYYLVNLYGDVPLTLTTDYVHNSTLPRTKTDSVYIQIRSDLVKAEQLLNSSYVDGSLIKPSGERTRPNKFTAAAMLARVCLFSKDYAGAASAATSVIGNNALYDTVPVAGVFQKNSKETIWSLQPVGTGENTKEAKWFIIPATGLTIANPAYVRADLMNAFETDDKRRAAWIDYATILGVSYPYIAKYKVYLQTSSLSEYSMVLRLAEQYLIRAEARAQENDLSGAQQDLNLIRQRAGLPNTTANTKEDLLDAILRERRVELFAEWAHRWLDLKRTGKVNDVMSVVTPQKGGVWKPEYQLYPIPQDELDKNIYLRQNPGYN